MKPPMVGVPALVTMWPSGPSSRIGWPRFCLDFSQRIRPGPTMKHRTIAVSTAAPVRNVR